MTCFSYDHCSYYNWTPCQDVHTSVRYNDVSAGWILVAAIIVFFMKGGFMLVELSFAHELRDQRHVVVIKYIDACASAFGFFLIGFDAISRYTSPQGVHIAFFELTNPVLWFFKFTFASNAATIVGGCLVTNKYKLRLPAAFISAFVISGITHPLISFLIWSDHCSTLSPYRFCQDYDEKCAFSCDTSQYYQLYQQLYVLDFAGGGAVHLVGGVASLTLCLFVKLHHWKNERIKYSRRILEAEPVRDEIESTQARNFLEWMYPANGGSEKVGEAALGVIILWFCWFAFNCGSTDSLESSKLPATLQKQYHIIPYHAVPSIIAVNMILAGATGGILAVSIASWSQLYFRTVSVNANEIANGILAALVAITAGCPFVNYWGACIIGFFAVILYHIGCYAEYKLGIEDTARVVPVHGICGLWSLLSVGLLVGTSDSECTLHSTFEGLCYCDLRLPYLTYGERLLAQITGSILMIGITGVISGLVYGLLYITPIQPFIVVLSRVFCLSKQDPLIFKGNWLLTSPVEDQMLWGMIQFEGSSVSSSFSKQLSKDRSASTVQKPDKEWDSFKKDSPRSGSVLKRIDSASKDGTGPQDNESLNTPLLESTA